MDLLHFWRMSSRLALLVFPLLLLCKTTLALAKTDTLTWGGSNDRSGYQNNHNMDPAIVGSAQFGLLFKTQLSGSWPIDGKNQTEQIFSQPLVYTGSDGVQYVYIATTQNNIYKLNSKTGAIVASRNLHRPFMVSDLDGCIDINPTVGITATGVIDPETNTWYVACKTYIDQSLNGARGRPNGRYYIHAISTEDLGERPNFPVDLEGMTARNNPVRSFNGGIHHQRPGLLHSGQYVYAGFASHCVQYNYTGWIVGWDKSSGKLVERFATEGAGVGNTVPGAGVWMSGGGLASDGKGSMYFATGNGYASQLSGIPVNGRNPPTSLEEAAVHMSINEDGSLSVVDFFMPWEKQQLDGADKDLGTSPLQILPSQFSCGSVSRIGVVTGKSGKTYFLNLDDLGGYQNGPNKLDKVIQVYQNENSVYAGAGVYPLEGGYIYINVIQYQTHVFKFACANGVASFNKISDSPEKNAYILGVGHGTTTSLNDQPGTGLLWIADVEGSNLRIYNAVPPGGGNLTLIKSFNIPTSTKFARTVFGDGIAYQVTTSGQIYAFGAPVNLPLNCTALQFGSINLNASSAAQTVQCRANIALTITGASLAGNPNFLIRSLPSLPVQLSPGQNFTFTAVFAPQIVGPLSSSVILNTTQQTTGYSLNTPVQLKGTGQSQAALFAISPNVVSWNGIITGQDAGGVNQSVVFANNGNSALTIQSIFFSLQSERGPWISPNVSGSATTVSAFSFYSLPSSVPPNSAVTVPINFYPTRSGSYAVYVQVTTNGGTKVFDVIAAGLDNPVALLEFQSLNGTWIKYTNTTVFSFGTVLQNTNRYLQLRLSNIGLANAAPLSVTVSKPPFGVSGSIIGSANHVELAEGSLIYAGGNATATLYCSVPKSQLNVDTYNGTAQWTVNLNDPLFGKQHIQFFCEAVSEQAPPLQRNSQQALYRYAGCFRENSPGRQLDTMIYNGANNTNEKCIAMCSTAGYIFAGTQYNQECWCGYNRPKLITQDTDCDFACTGNINQICGGNGVNNDGPRVSIFGDMSRWNGNTTDASGPYINPGVNGYRSVGCYTEVTGRALPVVTKANSTVTSCIQACKAYTYAGVEYGGECFCGNALNAGSKNVSLSDCNMSCNNNKTEFCGGSSRLNLYVYGNGTVPSSPSTTSTSGSAGTTSINPAIPTSIANFKSVSCYTELPAGRALSGFSLADDSMTLYTCASNCSAYQYFAVEYGRECYCGDSLAGGSAPATDGRCNMPCAGNTTLICGGPNGLQLYNQSSATTTMIPISFPSSTMSAISVQTSATAPFLNITTATHTSLILASTMGVVNATILTTSSITTFSSMSAMSTISTMSMSTISTSATVPTMWSNLTISATTQSTTGFTNTSNIFYTPTQNTSPLSITTAQMNTSPSSSKQSSLLSVLSTTSITPVTIMTTTTTTTTTPTTSSSTTASTQVSSQWKYLGCAPDQNPRTLSQASTTKSNMTIEMCQSFCISKNFPLAGIEYGTQCYCGSSFPPGTPLNTTGCTKPCAGNKTQICGGSSRLSIYNNTLYTPPIHRSPVIASSSQGTSQYTFLGCYTDTSPRTLASYSYSSTNMTETNCASTCFGKGYKYAGAEYATQCFCANGLAQAAVMVEEGQCTMMCAGDTREYCGAASRLSVWMRGIE